MVQSSMVGVFFAIGLVCGLVISFMVTTYTASAGNNMMLAATKQTHVEMSRTPLKSGIQDDLEKVTETPIIDSNLKGHFNKQPMSHDDLEKVDAEGPDKVIDLEKKDEHFHHDDRHVAEDLYKKVRILCWVMTAPENLESKARHVNATWGKRCNKVLYVSDEENKDFPTIGIKVDHGRDHLTAKTMGAFDYIYKNHLDDADWFLKGDDDSYVIVENLRYFLSSHSPNEPVFFGHHFKAIVKQGYFSGGGGYAVSKEALIRYGKRVPGTCAKDQGAEDVEWGRCMEKLGVKTGDSRDALGRSRFHCFNPATHIHGGYPDWYRQYDKYGAKHGIDSMSDYPITFHYVSVEEMYNLEYYVYHIKPYGVQMHDQDLNRHPGQNYPVRTTPSTTATTTTTTTTTTQPPVATTRAAIPVRTTPVTLQIQRATTNIVIYNRQQNEIIPNEQNEIDTHENDVQKRAVNSMDNFRQLQQQNDLTAFRNRNLVQRPRSLDGHKLSGQSARAFNFKDILERQKLKRFGKLGNK